MEKDDLAISLIIEGNWSGLIFSTVFIKLGGRRMTRETVIPFEKLAMLFIFLTIAAALLSIYEMINLITRFASPLANIEGTFNFDKKFVNHLVPESASLFNITLSLLAQQILPSI